MSKLPVALAAVRLLPFAEAGRGLIYVASGEHRAEGVAHLLSELAPEAAVGFIPSWDCLPYDRASPSPDVLGRTMAALRRLDAHAAEKKPGAGAVLVTTLEAAVQRLPPASAIAVLNLEAGDPLDPDRLGATLERFGYRHDDRVDDHGEFALRGEVVDLFPPGPTPYRLTVEAGRIVAIHPFDPLSQRSTGTVRRLAVDPVTTVLAAEGAGPLLRFAGIEHRLSEHYPETRTVFDVLPKAALMLEPTAESRQDEVLGQAAEHHRDAEAAGESRRAGGMRLLPPEALYLSADEWRAAAKRRRRPLPGAEPSEPVPHFHAGPNARKRFAAFVAERAAAGDRVVLAGATVRDRGTMARALAEGCGPVEAGPWAEVAAAAPGAVLTLPLSAEHGFVDGEAGLTMVCAGDLLGGRAHRADHHHHHAAAVPWHADDGEFAVGDTVVHIDHGVGRLRALETVESEAAGAHDAVRLDYAKDADLLAPVEGLDAVWRYGAAGDAVKLDRLDDGSWPKRRQRIFGEIATAARALVEMARRREQTEAAVLKAPAERYRAFAARFPYPPTPDQGDAIAAVVADLASGRPMDRLVVGDVGFGKTEVALRAAAVAALAGRQVAVVAPTTVLVRQHVATFAKRFAGSGIAVAQLSRLTSPAEARRIKAGLADGSVRIVVGTHAVAEAGFADLGLLLIDEEQRFGAAEKAKLRGLGSGVHVLTLSATPIPRTLQAALVGLQDLSVIATPPARRRPIRTVTTPYDLATVRGALLREQARGGQSFVVVPRIEAMERLAAEIAEACPELAVLSAHGRMSPDEVDAATVDFADGHGDVLVATSIIESGLDVPRANTMVVVGAELFGLAQLHQIRGRVGRGRLQGLCYLMTEGEVGEAASRRLASLAVFDKLGSGFALSGQDLDLRGAGDLVGEEQAGHLRLIGLGLYQHLMGLAIREAKGETVEDWSPEIHVDRSGSLPAAYIPEPELRLNLYARLARVSEPAEAEAVAEEMADRFGPPPPEVEALLERVRLRALCRAEGVARVDAGPKGIALDLRPGRDAAAFADRAPAALRDRIRLKGARLFYPLPSDTPRERLALATRLLSELG